MLLNKYSILSYRYQVLIKYIRRYSSSKIGGKGSKMSWAELKRKKWGSDYCLENFDEFYKPLFGTSWPSIRLGLLSQQKYCAFINNYAHPEQAETVMKKIGARDIRHEYNKGLAYMLRNLKEELPEGYADDLSQQIGDVQESVDYDEELTEEELDSDDYEDRFASQAFHKTANFNEFVPATKLKGLEEYLDESDYLFQKDAGGTFNFTTIKERPAMLPEAWKIFAFKPGNISTFPNPKSTDANVLGYYLMDMGSLLPVLALNPKPGDNILDMCAAPGGKTLAIMQTMYDCALTCNDSQLSRMKRLHYVFQTFVPSLETYPKLMVQDGIKFLDQCGLYNKILVDAPCTTDRLSANSVEHNIFHPTRMAERIRLPQLQTSLLRTALQAVKNGGTVVYSTCALSPVQNDGVVHMALRQLWEESSANFVIHDLSDLFYPLQSIFSFQSGLKYGQLVVPNVLTNFGPTYICKISKI